MGQPVSAVKHTAGCAVVRQAGAALTFVYPPRCLIWLCLTRQGCKRAVEEDVVDLPDELVALICTHLDVVSLSACLLVSQRWRQAFRRGVRRLVPKHSLLPKLPQRFPNLEDLSLERSIGSALTDATLATTLLPLTRLTRLSLRACSALTAAGAACLAQLAHLQDLDLTGCKRLSGRGLAALPAIPRLRRLQLDKCELLSDTALEHFACLTTLEELSLRGCTRVCGPGLASLSHHSRLAALNLAGLPELGDDALAPLACLAGLQHLVLDRWTGSGRGGGVGGAGTSSWDAWFGGRGGAWLLVQAV